MTGVQTCALRSEEHTSELQSHDNLVCRLLLEKKTKHYPALDQPPTTTRPPAPTTRQHLWAAGCGSPRAKARRGSVVSSTGCCAFFFLKRGATRGLTSFPAPGAFPP